MRTGEPRHRQPGAWRRFVLLVRTYPKFSVVAAAIAFLAVWLLVSYLVPRPAGHIRETLGGVSDGLEAADAQKVMQYVSPRFQEQGVDREELGRVLPRALSGDPVAGMSFGLQELDVTGGTARSRVRVSSSHDSRFGRVRATSEWRIHFERVDDQWLVTKAEPLRIGNRRVGGLQVVLGMGTRSLRSPNQRP
ncbi:MAG: hypothetical protein R6X33_15555 [Candidatus Brocadiia bacterium]